MGLYSVRREHGKKGMMTAARVFPAQCLLLISAPQTALISTRISVYPSL